MAPVLAAIGDQTVNEQAHAVVHGPAATDQDLPAQTLTYSLDAASLAAGMTITGRRGRSAGRPASRRAGRTTTVTVTVTDNGTNPANLTASQTFKITVNEVNVAPVLAAIGNQTVNEQAHADVHGPAATDQDLPAQTLTYSLDAASLAAGMTINGRRGRSAGRRASRRAGRTTR